MWLARRSSSRVAKTTVVVDDVVTPGLFTSVQAKETVGIPAEVSFLVDDSPEPGAPVDPDTTTHLPAELTSA